jgi:hypothetical protein
VKAYYVNNTESSWTGSKEVILKQGEVIRGDVDGDGKVSIDDVTVLIDMLLGGTGAGNVAADCDLDGKVNIDDVTVLIDRLLSGAW